MATGLARCRRFRSSAPPSWMKMPSRTRVSMAKVFIFSSLESVNFIKILFPALQCRLECESGYVAQRTPLITCVNGEYAKGCHYCQIILSLSHTPSKIVKLSLNTKGRPCSLNLDGFLEEEKTPRGGWVISDFKTQLQILYVLKQTCQS